MNLDKGNKIFDIPLISMMYMSMMYINYISKFVLILNIFGFKIFLVSWLLEPKTIIGHCYDNL
jgi:hypothetical protein